MLEYIMKKKGVSPVIATVLLVAVVVIIATIIFLWAQSFLAEKAQKGDRAVEISCGEVQFDSKIIVDATNCQNSNGGKSALDIDNTGNVPIYGLKIMEWDDTLGSVIVDESSAQGTIGVGNSQSFCLEKDVVSGNAFRIIPKLLAEDSDGRKTAYTCPEKDGITIAFG